MTADEQNRLTMIVVNALQKEHLDVKRMIAGFGTVEPCQCPACIAAVKLREEIESQPCK